VRWTALSLVAIGLLAGACSTEAQGSKPAAPTDVVATVGPNSILLSEVDQRALEQPASDFGGIKLIQALYEARRAALDVLVRNRLLDQEAQARGIDRATLVEREITSKVAVPTDDDIKAWYDANPDRVQGAPLAEVKSPITGLLTQQRTVAAQTTFVDSLRAKTPVSIMLQPPREKVAADGRPTRGPARSAVEIIEFSDFQCPYCLRSYPVVKQLLKDYGDRIHVVYRHFPLPNHSNARPAAEAAACAAAQGKFWEFHDELFENQSKLSDDDLRRHAAKVGLNKEKFDDCFQKRTYQADIDADIEAGRQAGVSGTPGFFINGRPLEGSQPIQAFKTIIDEELKH